MTRRGFEAELQALQNELLNLGSMIEKAIIRSVDSLKRRDLDLAERVIEEDKPINHKRYEIEEMCLKLLATQQPMAKDLRNIFSIITIAVELERMGDYAAGIAKVNRLIGDEPLIKPLIDIPRMAELALNMLRRSLDSFVRNDAEMALQVVRDDDMVDALHEQVYRELLTYMLQDPKTINQATYLTWVAHNLERIADRSTNICERTIFVVTGKIVEIGTSNY